MNDGLELTENLKTKKMYEKPLQFEQQISIQTHQARISSEIKLCMPHSIPTFQIVPSETKTLCS